MSEFDNINLKRVFLRCMYLIKRLYLTDFFCVPLICKYMHYCNITDVSFTKFLFQC